MNKFLVVVLTLLASTSAHATYLSQTANFYTRYQFGFIYEGKWVSSAKARGYVLTRSHSGSTTDSPVISENRDGVQEVELAKNSKGFTGKTLLSGSGIFGS